MPGSQPKGIVIVHKEDEHDVYGGRATNGRSMNTTTPGERGWLGNPHKITDSTSRDDAILQFASDFLTRIETDKFFHRAVRNLRGKRVGCWCRHEDQDAPLCHLDVIDAYLKGGKEGVRTFIDTELDRDQEQTTL